MKKLYIVATGLLAIAACNKNTADVVAPGAPVRFSVPANTFSFTKATEAALENADEIQIIAGAPINASTAGTVNGESITLSTPMYWGNGQTTATTFVAVYPNAELTSTTIDNYDLLFEGSHAFDYHKLFLVAKAESAPTTNAVALSFCHPLSKVLINVDNQLGADAVASVALKNIKMQGKLDLAAGTVDLTGVEDANVTAAKLSDTQWGVIVMPQSAQPTLEITTTLGTRYTFTLPAAFTFEAGKVATASVILKSSQGGGEVQGDAVSFSFSVSNWAAAEANPGFVAGTVTMGSYWYVTGCVYDDDATVDAWTVDFPMVFKGLTEGNDPKEIWEVTINYDETMVDNDGAKGFKLRRYSSETAEADKWNNQLGMHADPNVDFIDLEWPDYGLTGENNQNIRYSAAGRYKLTLTGNRLVTTLIPAN